MTASEIEKQIYDEYYNRNPYGDAREGLWGVVVRAKKNVDVLNTILEDVNNGDYDD